MVPAEDGCELSIWMCFPLLPVLERSPSLDRSNSCYFDIYLYIYYFVDVIWEFITVFGLYTLLAFLGDLRGGFVLEGSYFVWHYYY